MAIPEISGAAPAEQPNERSLQGKNANGSKTNKSVFDANGDGTVSADEQRSALSKIVTTLYHNIQRNLNINAAKLISKFSKTFKDIKINGNNTADIDKQIESRLQRHGNNIIKLIENGNDRTKEFKSQQEFIRAKNLTAGDYYVSEKGYIYQYNGQNRNWSVIDGNH